MNKFFEKIRNMNTGIAQQFSNWNKLKTELHLSSRIIYFYEKQLWWASIGQNIGSEQNGKNENFERPVLILKKFNGAVFLGVPISSKIKNSKYHFVFTRNGISYCANLSQIRTLSSRRLLRLLGKISRSDFNKIRKMNKEMS